MTSKTPAAALSLSQDDLQILMSADDTTATDFNNYNATVDEITDSFIEHPTAIFNYPPPHQRSDGHNTTTHRPNIPAVQSRMKEQEVTIAKQQLQMETLKQEFMQKIGSLEDRLGQSLRDKHLLQAKLNQTSQSNQVLASTKQPNFVLQRDMDDVCKVLDSGSVLISETYYVDLQQIPETQRTLGDRLRIKIFEEFHSIRSQLNNTTRERDQAKRVFAEVEGLRQRIKQEAEAAREKDQRLAGYATEVKRLENELLAERRKVESFHQQAIEVAEGNTRIQGYLQTIEEQKAEITSVNGKLKDSQASNQRLFNEKEELLRKLEIYKLDKTYLEKEITTINDRCKALEEKLARRSSELEAAKEGQLSQFQHILETTEKQRAEYEAKLQNELSSIRQRTSLDLEEIRRNTKDLYEREISSLKDTVASVTEENRRKETILSQLRLQYQELTHQFHREKAKLESDLSGLEQQIKLKSFETDRFKVIYEDTVQMLRTVQLENEKLARKFDVLNREYHQLQSESVMRITELETIANGRLQKLKLLGAGSAGEKYDYTPDGEETVAISAQKLTELKKQMAAERAENSRLKSEIRMLDELIGKTREPQTTLIHTIRDKQVRIQQLADDLELAEQQLRQVEADKSTLLRERNELLDDLNQLADNQKQIEEIREFIVSLGSGAVSGSSIASARKSLTWSRSSVGRKNQSNASGSTILKS